jgi:hypothetical protein
LKGYVHPNGSPGKTNPQNDRYTNSVSHAVHAYSEQGKGKCGSNDKRRDKCQDIAPYQVDLP